MNDIRVTGMSTQPAVPLSRYQVPGMPFIISIDQEGGSLSRYQIIEPVLTEIQEGMLETLRNRLNGILRDRSLKNKFSRDFSGEFTRTAEVLFPALDRESIKNLEYYIRRDVLGLGAIQPLICDPSVTAILVRGPEQFVTVTHSAYGSLTTSLFLSGEEIITLLRKICRKAVIPVEISDLPSTITLRSGLSVRLRIPGDGTIPMRFSIEKENQPKITVEKGSKKSAPDTILTTYRLYHDKIEVKISTSTLMRARYQISLIPLSQQELSAVERAREENQRRSGLLSFRGGAFQISRDEFSRFIRQGFPAITEERLPLLYTAFSFGQDTVRWIRVILADNQVRSLFCSHPGIPVQVCHSLVPGTIKTTVIPDRSDLNRFADILIKSSGRAVDPGQQDITLRFRTGEQINLVRVMDDQGHYYRIVIRKNGKQVKSESNTESHRKAREIPPGTAEPRQPDPRVEKLLARIFSKGMARQVEPREEKREDESIHFQKKGFLDQIIQPIRAGFRGFSPSSRKTGKPGSHDAPVPVSAQVPSVLSVQTEDGCTAEEAYWLSQPHAYAVIIQDHNRDRSYRVIEPELSPRERIVLEETHETLRDVLVYDKPVAKGDLFLEYEEVAKVVRTYDPRINDDRLSVLYYYLRRNLNGYGKIDSLMYDELLEDISCNGHDLPVYIHHRYYGSIPTSIRFVSEELNRFVLKLSQKADKQVSLTSPLLDASLPNGARAQITYSDVVSTKGSSFTIRKFRSDPMTPATLLAFGTYSDELLAFIWLALENRQSLIVVGGTASGKTSAMNAFSFFIPHNSKIVSLEDTREIQIPQKNWLPVQTRTSNSQNERGSVDLFDLLKASLRQRPEYIIVGEVRGNEAQTLFQAMNSGHTTLSTLHAGNIEEALNRLTNEPINVPPAMFGALNLVVIQTFHYREGKMIRRCDAIHEIVLGESDKVGWNTLFEYEPRGDGFRRVYSSSKTLRTIQYMHNWSDEEIRYQLDLRAGFLARLRNQYSTDSEVLIRMITDLRRLA